MSRETHLLDFIQAVLCPFCGGDAWEAEKTEGILWKKQLECLCFECENSFIVELNIEEDKLEIKKLNRRR